MKIMLAWEYGRNYGHAAKLVQLARPLAESGAHIYMALQKPGVIRSMEPDFPHTLLQAPFSPVKPLPDPVQTFTDDLRPCGYTDPAVLSGLIQSWQSLYTLIAPDILITQSALTAQIAAKPFSFAKADIGTGYEMPPLSSPLPPLRYWEPVEEDRIARRENEVLDTINAALRLLGQAPLGKFLDAYDGFTRFLTTFEELDHYKDRKGERFVGSLFTTQAGAPIKWHDGAEKRIFAYLRPGAKSFMPALDVLSTLPERYDVIISAPGISADLKQKRESPHIGIENGPVKLDRIFKQCDLAVCHAGEGLAAAFLTHGVPLLMLPGHIEQLMLARAVGRTGAGRGVIGDFGAEKVRELLDLLLEGEEFKQSAQAFARKYKTYKPEKTAQSLAQEILSLVKHKKRKKHA